MKESGDQFQIQVVSTFGTQNLLDLYAAYVVEQLSKSKRSLAGGSAARFTYLTTQNEGGIIIGEINRFARKERDT